MRKGEAKTLNKDYYKITFPAKVTSKQAAILVSQSHIFSSSAQHMVDLRINQYKWLSTLSFVHIFDPTILYKKGCISSNKNFSFYSFLDWEGHHWVFISTLTRPQHQTHYQKRVQKFANPWDQTSAS